MNSKLNRFIEAQEQIYTQALTEIKSGKKQSHWMWYIFPQIKGLGHSSTSQFYGINNIVEAKEYLIHPILGARLREISNVLHESDKSDAFEIFGSPDFMKLKSSMTLFAIATDEENNVFKKVLDKFFNSSYDRRTLELLGI
jgi:uncharacterized protein (DUF1810 family)